MNEAILDRTLRRWPVLWRLSQEYGADSETVREVVHRLRPLIVAAYRRETKREGLD